MKKNSTPKLFGLALTAALTLATLTACGSPAGTGSSQGAAGNSEPVMQPDAGGSVNPEIEIDYDKAGNVVALTGLNADGQAVLASYTGYEGKACTAVVSELVDEINAGGYFDATIDGHEKNIVLKMERGSAYPSDQFLNDLAEAVRLVVEADQIGSQTVALDSDDYDDAYGDKGYINAAAAQNILSAQLGRDDIQFVEKDYDLDDGEYEVEFVLDGVEYEYEVNAITGKVTEMDMDYQDYDDTDYGPDSDGITDYGDTDYGPNADGITDYDDTDYGPNADGITDYDDTDYGPNADGITDYNDGDDDDWDDDDDDDWDGEDHWDDDDDNDDDWDD